LNGEITYVLIDTFNHELSSYALETSQQRFPLNDVLIFSDKEDKWVGREVVLIPEIKNIGDYNKVVFFELPKHLKTNYALMIQYDGFVLSGDFFSEQFLSYDFVGAPWPHHHTHNVGNGGFSLRSKALIEAVQNFILPGDLMDPEDTVICRYLRSRMEDKLGLRFAPESVAETFSYELRETNLKTFGFHGVFHLPSVMKKDITTLFAFIHPHSVAKYFRSFRNACGRLPPEGQQLFQDYCNANMPEMLKHAESNAEK
jgi:hypothetical protein